MLALRKENEVQSWFSISWFEEADCYIRFWALFIM